MQVSIAKAHIAVLRKKMGKKKFEKLYDEVIAELEQGGANE